MYSNRGNTSPYQNVESSNKRLLEEIDNLENEIENISNSLSALSTSLSNKANKTDTENSINFLSDTADNLASDLSKLRSDIIYGDIGKIEEANIDELTINNKISAGGYHWDLGSGTIINNSSYLLPRSHGIYFLGSSRDVIKNAIIQYNSKDNFIILSNTDDFVSYKDGKFAVSDGAAIFSIGNFDVMPVTLTDPVSTKAGVTVVGNLYAQLASANVNNLNVVTLTAEEITADNLTVEDKAEIKELEVENETVSTSSINELEADSAKVKELNTSQINTKVDEEYIGYTIIPEHQSGTDYLVVVPATNGIWNLELPGYFKATIVKTNNASTITYSRTSKQALSKVEVKDNNIYLFTEGSGKLYFANNSLEDDNTVATYVENPPYEEPEESIELIAADGTVNTGSTIVNDLTVTGELTIKDYAANKLNTKANESEGTFYPTFVDSNNIDKEPEDVYTSSNISINPNTGTLTSCNAVISNCLTVGKNAEVCGCLNVVECIKSCNDKILLRNGNNSRITTGGLSGIEINKYNGTSNTCIGVDNTGTLRVGNSGTCLPVMTRAEASNLTNNGLLLWDATNTKAINKPGLIYCSTNGKIYVCCNSTLGYKCILNESDIKNLDLTLAVETTHDCLVTCMDCCCLTPGQVYIITDYATTSSRANTFVNNNICYDIIICATSNNTFSTDARARPHRGCTYSNNCPEKWILKYDIRNNTCCYTWAKTGSQGKGVVYYLLDEFNNELWYDFYNIGFIVRCYCGTMCAYTFNTESTYDCFVFQAESNHSYTFTFNGQQAVIGDSSSSRGCYCIHDNHFCPFYSSCTNRTFNNKLDLPFNTFGRYTFSNTFGNNIYSNIFGNYIAYNNFGCCTYCNVFSNCVCGNIFGHCTCGNMFGCFIYTNTFGCCILSNTFYNSIAYNTFGNITYCNTFCENICRNTFGEYIYCNTFGCYLENNTFGNYTANNTFCCWVTSNTFGNYTLRNIFGRCICYNTFCYCNECNKFGNNIIGNMFGSYNCCNTFNSSICNNIFSNYAICNTFGGNIDSNTFGSHICYNTFGSNIDSNTFGSHICYNTFCNCICYNTFGGCNCCNKFSCNVCYNTFGGYNFCNTFGSSICSNIFSDCTICNIFGNNIYDNTFGSLICHNTFCNAVHSNKFGSCILYNTFCNCICYNTFGNYTANNTFGCYVCYNTFLNKIYCNTFGDCIDFNRFGDNICYNKFCNNILTNTFGDNIYQNTFGDFFVCNTFGNNILANTFGCSTGQNIFGDCISWNTFGNNTDCNTFGSFITYNAFEPEAECGGIRSLHFTSNLSGYNFEDLSLFDDCYDYWTDGDEEISQECLYYTAFDNEYWFCCIPSNCMLSFINGKTFTCISSYTYVMPVLSIETCCIYNTCTEEECCIYCTEAWIQYRLSPDDNLSNISYIMYDIDSGCCRSSSLNNATICCDGKSYQLHLGYYELSSMVCTIAKVSYNLNGTCYHQLVSACHEF